MIYLQNRFLVGENMVWCPVHSKYFNGDRAKTNHAYGDYCYWMRNYLLNFLVKRKK